MFSAFPSLADEIAHAVAEDIEGVRIGEDLGTEAATGGRHVDKFFRFFDNGTRFEGAAVFFGAEEEFHLLEIFIVFNAVTGGFETDGADGFAV